VVLVVEEGLEVEWRLEVVVVVAVLIVVEEEMVGNLEYEFR